MRKVIGRGCRWGLGISCAIGRGKRGRYCPPAVRKGAARGKHIKVKPNALLRRY
jgi:hypothetical protein